MSSVKCNLIIDTAKQDAVAMVEMIREYLVKRVAELEKQIQADASSENEENTKSAGVFNGLFC